MNKPITVSLVDDSQAVRESLTELINYSKSVHLISSHATAENALEEIPRNPPDVVLMDIRLPQMSGIECTRRLKAMCPNLCILMLTTYSDNNSIFDALRSGAGGYLLKRATTEVLVKSIEEAYRGGAPMSSQIAQQVVRHFHTTQHSEPQTETLTTREQELLMLLSKGRHYKEIADAMDISVDTVRSHIRRVYEKLHVHSRFEAVMKLANKGNSSSSAD
ncbi:MAG: response regulator transcription factor [Verrucomicrobiae bacterium]